MLVLSRKVNEELLIGDDVRVVVVAICGDRVRLGIAAPKEVAVHRKEVYDIIQHQKTVSQVEGTSENTTGI